MKRKAAAKKTGVASFTENEINSATTLNPSQNSENQENESTLESQSTSHRRKQPHIYSVDQDVDILYAVLDVKPFGKNSTETSWMEVHDQVAHINTDWKSKKNRFLNEVKWFSTHENKSKRGSGVVENYVLKDQLLTEIIPLMKEAEINKTLSSSDRNKRSKDKAAGEEIRDAAMRSMGPKNYLTSATESEKSPEGNSDVPDDDSRDTPIIKRRKGQEILELIRLKDIASQKTREEELMLKREKLELLKSEKVSEIDERNRKLILEERRLALEEKKLEFEIMKYNDKKQDPPSCAQ